MPWPLSQDYNEAIQNPAQCFADPELRQGEAETNDLGLPAPRSGNFADVYAVVTGSRKCAVKCFTRQIPGLQERYRQVSLHLAQVKLPFMVDFTFQEKGIRVRGLWYPILKMQWVDGLTLNQFIKANVDKPHVLDLLCQLWVKLAGRLREANIAHCDLQHGNVLLVPASRARALQIKLVDYDGMCVPALTLLKSIEVGHPAYQHPQRQREGIYDLEVDRFSHLVIYTALRALMAGGQELWDRHDDGDNLLFKPADYAAPTKSRLFYNMLKSASPEVSNLVDVIMKACAGPLEKTPLLEQLAAAGAGTVPPTRTSGTGQKVTPRQGLLVSSRSSKSSPSDSQRLSRARKRAGRRRRSLMLPVAVILLLTAAAVGVAVFWLFPEELGIAPAKDPVAQRSTQPKNSSEKISELIFEGPKDRQPDVSDRKENGTPQDDTKKPSARPDPSVTRPAPLPKLPQPAPKKLDDPGDVDDDGEIQEEPLTGPRSPELRPSPPGPDKGTLRNRGQNNNKPSTSAKDPTPKAPGAAGKNSAKPTNAPPVPKHASQGDVVRSVKKEKLEYATPAISGNVTRIDFATRSFTLHFRKRDRDPERVKRNDDFENLRNTEISLDPNPQRQADKRVELARQMARLRNDEMVTLDVNEEFLADKNVRVLIKERILQHDSKGHHPDLDGSTAIFEKIQVGQFVDVYLAKGKEASAGTTPRRAVMLVIVADRKSKE
jgi:hypothetical protein